MVAMERAVAAARAAAAARVGARAPPAAPAALPREDALPAGAAAAAAPARAGAPLPPPPPTLHTVFIDGPRCPARIAAAAPGGAGGGAAAVVDARVDGATAARLGAVFSAQPVIRGDSKVWSIAAASLVAKVTRDRLMRAAAADFPGYGFESHKGYGCAAHMAALAKLGPCAIHRLTFAPLKTWDPARAERARAGAPPAAAGSGGVSVAGLAAAGDAAGAGATCGAVAPHTAGKRARRAA
jgi:hypothetical protein